MMEYVTFEYLQSIKWLITGFAIFVGVPAAFWWGVFIYGMFTDDGKKEKEEENYKDLYLQTLKRLVDQDMQHKKDMQKLIYRLKD